MKKIKTSKNIIILIDNEDFNNINKWSWQVDKRKYTAYATRTQFNKQTRKTKIIYMHRVIMNAKSGQSVDHIDGNGLNNQKSNLRICNQSKNTQRARKQKNRSSKYKGVSYDPSRKKYFVQIYIKGKSSYVGRYKNEIDAALAYNEVSIKHYGKYAYINKIGK